MNIPFHDGGYDVDECFISGDDIVLELDSQRIDIFKFDSYSARYKRNQDPLTGEHGSVSFNNNHLVYSAVSSDGGWVLEQDCYGHKPEGFYVYHKQDVDQAHHQPYIFQQYVNFTDLGYSIECVSFPSISSISHDKDLLVVGGVNKTHIYLQDNDGSWEKQLTFDNWYREYRLSGRNVLAAIYNETTNEDEVYYFNIEECASTPTQVPSSSIAPSFTTSPTQVPSIHTTETFDYVGSGLYATPEPVSAEWFDFCSPVSIASTASISSFSISSPSETCYWVDIVVAFDNEPLLSVWDIQRVKFGNNDLLGVSRGTSDDVFKTRKESMCLASGVYQFTMHNDKPTGEGLKYPGYYNVSSGGDMIAQGREFSCNETTTFSLPLTAAPSMMPSVSSLPTITCYWVDIVVFFDEYPPETSWQIQKLNDSGGDIVLKTFNGTSSEANELHKESICLEGEQTYRLAVYDEFGDGFIAPGHYNMTSNGVLIVQGGEFGLAQMTTFSIPFVPGTAISDTITKEPTTSAQTLMPTTPFPTESPPTTSK